MIFFHGFLAWFTAHCWGSRFGANWMRRIDPAWANEVFISPRFLRFCFILTVIEIADIVLLLAGNTGVGLPLAVVLCLLSGTGSGLLLGRAAY